MDSETNGSKLFNPWVILLAALVSGSGGGVLFSSLGPNPRPDPWTGASDRDVMSKLRQEQHSHRLKIWKRIEQWEDELDALPEPWTMALEVGATQRIYVDLGKLETRLYGIEHGNFRDSRAWSELMELKYRVKILEEDCERDGAVKR